MSISVLVHVADADPLLGEIEQMPDPKDQFIVIQNPRRRDGKDIHYILDEVTTVIWPMSRINFIEIMPSAEEDEIVTFVRE